MMHYASETHFFSRFFLAPLDSEPHAMIHPPTRPPQKSEQGMKRLTTLQLQYGRLEISYSNLQHEFLFDGTRNHSHPAGRCFD